ncbi:MAG: dihydrolipoamide acetyltransferase family protein [Rhodospirillales bacterium]
MTTFKLPDLGEGLHEAEIVSWHVEPGAHVVADQPLVSVETDKAVVEIPAPAAGRVVKLHAAPGQVVKIGAPLVEFDTAAPVDSGGIVGELARESQRIDETTVGETAAPVRVKATPAVRALARKLGVDLAAVDASGPEGAITAADVERVAQSLSEMVPPEPLRGVRRVMAQKMAQSHAEVVPTTVVDEVDVDAWAGGADVTIRLIRAIAAACAAQPALNAWFDSREGSRRLHRKVDLGIAVHTDDGLFVPVMRDIGGRSEADLRRGVEAMKQAIAARQIPAEEMRGATITLSNFGLFGAGRFAALVVIPPQVAIIGAGRIAKRVVAVDDAPAVRRMMPISLTFDHRVVNGGEAAGFLAALAADLKMPA